MVELPPGPAVCAGGMEEGRPDGATGDRETFSCATVVMIEDAVVTVPLTTRSGLGSGAPCLIILLCDGLRPLTTSLTARA